MLIAVMILGVGYAAVSDTLNFSGDATISDSQVKHEFDVDVSITAVSEDNATWIEFAPSTVEIDRTNDLIVNIIDGAGDNVQDQADFQIYTLTDAGESKEIWFRVSNESAHDATLVLSEIAETGSGDYFDSDYVVLNAAGTDETAVLPANGEVLVKVIITLKTTPSETYSGNFAFSITAKVGEEEPQG